MKKSLAIAIALFIIHEFSCVAQSLPFTALILDDFNRANESPASGWTTISENLSVENNQLSCTISENCSGHYDTQFDANDEIYFTLSELQAEYTGLSFIFRGTFSLGDGYEIYIWRSEGSVGNVSINIWPQNGLGDANITLSAGDVFGVITNDDNIIVYQNGTEILNVNDSTYTNGGYAGFLFEYGGAIDDFGGGTAEQQETPETLQTDTYDIDIIITNTNHISLTTTRITTDTYSTSGYIYINPFAVFNPIIVFASLIIFGTIGVIIKQPIWISLVWAILLFTGIFSSIGIYWHYSGLVVLALYFLFKLLKSAREV